MCGKILIFAQVEIISASITATDTLLDTDGLKRDIYGDCFLNVSIGSLD